MLTGARQVGKTTLVRERYPALRYISCDAIEDRDALRRTRTADWPAIVGSAAIDEAQKEPSVFDKVKHAYDAGDVDFSVLLGSSRFLLLDRVRESLAGRAFVYELWPLMPSEIRTAAGDAVTPPLFAHLTGGEQTVGVILSEVPAVLLGDENTRCRAAIDHLATWGGMPELLRLDDGERREWLRSYHATFLERDLADLTRLSDLEPFRALQRIVMLRTGQLFVYADVARDACIAPTTARRYLEFLRISYQAFLLRPYRANLTSSVVKAPKVYWTDLGILRHGLGQWSELTGAQFETLVVTEAHKWISTCATDAHLTFYRTRSGLEVDLLIETPAGLIGIEVKQRSRAHSKDLRGLRALAGALGDRWRGGLVVHAGDTIERIDADHDIWAMPIHRLF